MQSEMGAFFFIFASTKNPLTYENTTYQRLASWARTLRL